VLTAIDSLGEYSLKAQFFLSGVSSKLVLALAAADSFFPETYEAEGSSIHEVHIRLSLTVIYARNPPHSETTFCYLTCTAIAVVLTERKITETTS
jgi:hypothetical protein